MVVWRRHLPSWTTSGMPVPVGALGMTKLPSGPETAPATAWSDVNGVHLSHEGPVDMAGKAPLGMNTKAL